MPDTGIDDPEHARRAGGTLCTSEALDAGVHPATLYALRDDGDLIQLARGLIPAPGRRRVHGTDRAQRDERDSPVFHGVTHLLIEPLILALGEFVDHHMDYAGK